jgi:hypothetical protein
MCKPFSGIVTKSGKGYYDNKIQSHSEIIDLFKNQDSELIDDKLPPDNTFGRFEITPDNGNLLLPDKWSFKLDEDIKPKWWRKIHEEKAWELHKVWIEWLHKKIDVSKYPINPFTLKYQPIKKLPDSIMDSIGYSIRYSIWDSIRDLIGDSIGDSIWDSIRDSTRDSIRYSIWDSIRDSTRDSIRYSIVGSIWDSIWVNIAYIFPDIWKQYKQYKPIIDLWHRGIVQVWYLSEWHYFGSPEGDGKCIEVFPNEN